MRVDLLFGTDDDKSSVVLDESAIGRTLVTVRQFKTYCLEIGINFSKFIKPKWGRIDDHPMVESSELLKVMQQVAISDHAYSKLQQAAAENRMSIGASIEVLVSEDDHEHLFTTERLAVIDAEADSLSGNVYSPEQVRDFIQQKHDAWLLAHPN